MHSRRTRGGKYGRIYYGANSSQLIGTLAPIHPIDFFSNLILARHLQPGMQVAVMAGTACFASNIAQFTTPPLPSS